jgi:hypothetical protein
VTLCVYVGGGDGDGVLCVPLRGVTGVCCACRCVGCVVCRVHGSTKNLSDQLGALTVTLQLMSLCFRGIAGVEVLRLQLLLLL